MTKDKISNQHLVLAKEKGYTCDEDGNIYGLRGIKINPLLAPDRRKFTIRTDELTGERSTTTIPAHRFVAYCKYGDKLFEEGIVVRHLDGNVLNDSWDNLRLGTQSQNMMDRPKEDRIAHAKRAASFIRKYTDEEEEKIYNFYLSCKSYKQTIEKFNVSNKNMLFRIIKKFA